MKGWRSRALESRRASRSEAAGLWLLLLAVLAPTLLAPAAARAVTATSQVIPAPYRMPELNLPHPAYNGHPTRFKAIARNLPAGCTRPYFRWDGDGDGRWDTCLGRTPVAEASPWYQDDRYLLDCLLYLPEVDPAQVARRLFVGVIEVSCRLDEAQNGLDSLFGSYPVLVEAGIPPGRRHDAPYNQETASFGYSARPAKNADGTSIPATCSGGSCQTTGFPCTRDAECQGDDDAQLAVKRAVAIDDALWWLHRSLTERTGEDVATLSARPACDRGCTAESHLASAAAFLWAASQNGHLPAYPPGTYRHDPLGRADVVALPEGWLAANDRRYASDPYAEDLARVLNYLLARLTPATSLPASAEADDSRPAIPGTNDGGGLRAAGPYGAGHVLAALANSGMAGTTCQVFPCNGHSLAWVIQELADAACADQVKEDGGEQDGAWGYVAGGPFDGSTSQWLLLGLDVADRVAGQQGVIVNKDCKYRVANLLLQAGSCANGSGRYQLGLACQDPHLTGGILVGHGWLGISSLPYDSITSFAPKSNFTNSQLIDRYRKSLEYLGQSWWYAGVGGRGHIAGSFANPGARFDGRGMGEIYTIFSIQQGLRSLVPAVPTLTGPDGKPIDWRRDVAYYLINSQHQDGSTLQRWSAHSAIGFHNVSTALRTAWGAGLSLSATLSRPGPVALGQATPLTTSMSCVGQQAGRVTFDHTSSYHLDEARTIREYQWIFEGATGLAADFTASDWAAIPLNGSDPTKRLWRGDGRGKLPVHVYAQAGRFDAALRVIDDASPPREDIFLLRGIEVLAQEALPPAVQTGGPYAVTAGEPLTLQGAATDPNSVCNPAETLTAKWYLDDDAVADLGQLTGTIAWPTLAGLGLPRNRPVAIRLVVVDATGKSTEARTTLAIYERAPSACFTLVPHETAGCDEPVHVDASCSTHPDRRRTLTGFEWDWETAQPAEAGDEIDLEPVTQGRVASHTYPRAGRYRITLRVTDDLGAVAVTQQELIVAARRGPLARAGGPYLLTTWLDVDGTRQGGTLQLDGSGSTDPDSACGDAVKSYAWDLDGDGQYPDLTGMRPSITWTDLATRLEAAGQPPAGLLADPASGRPRLPITLRVTDGTGRSHEALTSLTILHDGPLPALAVTPHRAGCGQEVRLDATASHHGHPAHAIVLYEWDFDVAEAHLSPPDLAAVAAAFEPEQRGTVVRHRYPRFGLYRPVLRVTDDLGRQTLAIAPEVAVDLGNRAPAIDTGGPYVHYQDGVLAVDATGTVDPDEACGDQVASLEWDLDDDGEFDDLSGAQGFVSWAELGPKLQSPRDYPTDPRTGLPAVRVRLRATDSRGLSTVASTWLRIYDRHPYPVPSWGPQPAVPILPNGKATIDLDGSASYHGHPDHTIERWTWRFPGGAQTTGQQTRYVLDLNNDRAFWDSGVSKTVILRVTDNLAQTKDIGFEVLFRRQASRPPLIRFDAPREGIFVERGEGFAISAARTVDPDGDWIRTVSWELTGDGQDDVVWERTDTNGDGTRNELDEGPTYALQLSWEQMGELDGLQGVGMHPLRLTVTDAVEVAAQDTVPLHVLEHALVAEAQAIPAAGSCATRFLFDGSASRHLFPDGVVATQWWDFDDDGVIDAAGETVEHTFGVSGEQTVRLIVTDIAGRTAETTLQVLTTEGNLPPLADAGGPYLVDTLAPTDLELDASRSTEPDQVCGDAIVHYRWDLDGVLDDQGERSWEVETDEPIVQLDGDEVATLLGEQTATEILLQVEDSLGGRAEATATLLVADGRPVAHLRVSPAMLSCGQPVTVDATGSYHPVDGEEIVQYEWDIDHQVDGPFVSSLFYQGQREFSLHLDGMGTRWIAVRVTDGRGRSAIAAQRVEVAGDNRAPVARVLGGLAATAGQPLVLDGAASTDPNASCGDAIVSWEWDLDADGDYEVVADRARTVLPWASLLALDLEHADPFTGQPSYPVGLRVTDAVGSTGETTTQLRLYAPGPVAVATVQPGVTGCGGELTFDGRGSYPAHPDRHLVGYFWDFDVLVDGDGNGHPADDVDAKGPLARHVYTRMAGSWQDGTFQPGAHGVALTVVDDRGGRGTSQIDATLLFQNLRPIAVPGGPYVTSPVAGRLSPLALDGSGSRDPDAPCDAITAYLWDTDGDGKYGAEDQDGAPLCGPFDCSGATPTLQLDRGWRPGKTGRVALKVRDAYGLESRPVETTIQVGERSTPSLVLLSPAGGEAVRGLASVRLRVAQPQGKRVVLEMKLNGLPLTFQGGARVAVPADGRFAEVTRTFDSKALPDGSDQYQLQVTARLDEDGRVLTTTGSREPFTIDNTPPSLTLPAAERSPKVEQADLGGTPFTFHPTVSDLLDPRPRLKIEPLLAKYPLGTTRVTFRAEDRAGNQAVTRIDLQVEDTRPPQLLPLADVTQEATHPTGTPVPLSPAAWDICDAQVTVTADAPPDGFPVGVHLVTFTATDDTGNQQQATAQVTITDTTPPAIVLPAPAQLTVEQVEPRGVLAGLVPLPRPILRDNGSPSEELSCRFFLTLRDPDGREVSAPPDGYPCGVPLTGNRYFPPGDSVVRFVATDEAGNEATADLTVAVVDHAAPQITVVTAPPTDRWQQEEVTLAFRVTDGSDPAPEVTVTPLPAGLEALPAADAQGVITLRYAADGMYAVRIAVRDALGRRAQQSLPRFGIDRSPPLPVCEGFPAEGVELDDPASWPLLFPYEELRPRFGGSDLLSGVSRLEVRLLSAEPSKEIALLDQDWALSGSPASGPRFPERTVCADPARCPTGLLPLTELALGAHRLKLTLRDGVDHEAQLQLPFRLVDLPAALALVRAELDQAEEEELLPPDRLAQLHLVDQSLAGAELSLAKGYLGGCLLGIEEALVGLNALADVIPTLAARSQLLARGATSAVRQRGESQPAGSADAARAADAVARAEQALTATGGGPTAALLTLQEAFFLLRNGEQPCDASDIPSSVPQIRQLLRELDEYKAIPDIPGGVVVAQVAVLLRDDVLWKLEDLQTLPLDAQQHVRLLFDLQDAADALSRAEDLGCWARNWKWGLAQLMRVAVLLTADKAAAVLPEGSCLLDEAYALVQRGEAPQEGRAVDTLLALYGTPRTRCLLLQLYAAAGFQPPFVLSDHGCLERLCE